MPRRKRSAPAHQYPDDLPKLSSEETITLAATMYTGGEPERKAARKRLIKGYVPLCLSLVGAHVRRFPDLQYALDDLTSILTLELTRTVNRFSKRPYSHPGSTIVNALRHALKTFHDSGLGQLNHQTIRRAKIRKARYPGVQEIQQHDSFFTDRDPGDGDDDLVDARPSYQSGGMAAKEALAEVLRACHDEIDTRIVELSAEDWTPKEIAKELGYGKNGASNVSKRLRQIRERYEARQC